MPFLPGHPLADTGGQGPAVSGAPFGSAGIRNLSGRTGGSNRGGRL